MRDKAELMRVRDRLMMEFATLGILPNVKKTQIIKLRRGFTFLKTQFRLKDNGQVQTKPARDSIIRQRRKLKAFRRFVDQGEMTMDQVDNSYMSWRGSMKRKNAHYDLLNVDRLYFRLFARRPWLKKKKKRRKGYYHHAKHQGNHHGGNHGAQKSAG